MQNAGVQSSPPTAPVPNRLHNVVPLTGAFRRPGTKARANGGATPPLVPYPSWQRASDRVGAALLARETRLVVVGPPGTGKSLLLDNVSKMLRAAGWTVILRQADASPLPPGQLGPVALLIDEADRVAPEDLAPLLQTVTGPIVLAGLDVLARRLPNITKVALPALTREQARDFIAQWLALTGRTPANLETAGMRRLVELAGGVPRLLSTLLGAASWLAETADETVLTQVHVEEAAALRSTLSPVEMDAPPPPAAPAPKRASRLVALLPVASILLLLGAGALLVTRFLPGEFQRTASATSTGLVRLQADLGSWLRGWFRPESPSQPAPKLAEAVPAPGPSVAAAVAPPPLDPVAAPMPMLASPAPADGLAPPEPDKPLPPAIAPVTADQSAGQSRAPDIAQHTNDHANEFSTPTAAQRAAPTVLALATPPHPASPIAAETLDLLLRRGREMMTLGDVSAARLLLARAAEAGSAEAMLEMGRSFDPAELAQANLLAAGDPTEAADWYRRAAKAGSKDALSRLDHVSETPR